MYGVVPFAGAPLGAILPPLQGPPTPAGSVIAPAIFGRLNVGWLALGLLWLNPRVTRRGLLGLRPGC